MKTVHQDNDKFVLRFDKDEEVIAGIIAFMQAQSIKACSFFGIGAAAEIKLGYYNPFLKSYRDKPYVDELEIISLNGIGAVKDGQPTLHTHGQFGRNDFSVLGGHVFSVKVSVVCEVFLTKMEGEMKRETNADFNLDFLV